MSISTFQVRKVCKCDDCGLIFDIDAEVETDEIVCSFDKCLSANILVIGSTVIRKQKK